MFHNWPEIGISAGIWESLLEPNAIENRLVMLA